MLPLRLRVLSLREESTAVRLKWRMNDRTLSELD
jgi:hypothetical protein